VELADAGGLTVSTGGRDEAGSTTALAGSFASNTAAATGDFAVALDADAGAAPADDAHT